MTATLTAILSTRSLPFKEAREVLLPIAPKLHGYEAGRLGAALRYGPDMESSMRLCVEDVISLMGGEPCYPYARVGK